MFKIRGKGGYTIIEMSLVLLLGGMLMGGVLRGETLTEGFQVRRLIIDLQNISISYSMYVDRYNAVPGDDSGNHGWKGVSAGNRNGLIEGGSAADGEEAHEEWQSLRYAGLLTGNPEAKGEDVFIRSPFGGRYFLTHRNFGGGVGRRNCIRVDDLSGSIAEQIDREYDDGIYNRGSITASASYVNKSVNLYYAMWL